MELPPPDESIRDSSHEHISLPNDKEFSFNPNFLKKQEAEKQSNQISANGGKFNEFFRLEFEDEIDDIRKDSKTKYDPESPEHKETLLYFNKPLEEE